MVISDLLLPRFSLKATVRVVAGAIDQVDTVVAGVTGQFIDLRQNFVELGDEFGVIGICLCGQIS